MNTEFRETLSHIADFLKNISQEITRIRTKAVSVCDLIEKDFYKGTAIEQYSFKFIEIAAEACMCIDNLGHVVHKMADQEDNDQKNEFDITSEEEIAHMKHMQLVHTVEKAMLESDAIRARGDILFMEAVQNIQNDVDSIREDDEALLTDLFLSLKDIYDYCYESMENAIYIISEKV